MELKDFLLWEARSRDTLDVKRCYIDVAGDLIGGVLLSQIIYWHLPNRDGTNRLTIEHDGFLWLAKKREDWWEECRITPKQFDRAVKILEQKNLVITDVMWFQGSPTKHIRLDWGNLFVALESLSDKVLPQRLKSKFLKGEELNSPKVNLEVPQRLNSIYIDSEITPEITSETTHKEEEAAAENFDFETVEVLPPRTSIEPPPKEKEVQINFSPSRIGELIAVPFEHVAYDWRLRPWMLSQTNFAPEMIQAVWQCNIEWYSLEGSKTPNLKKITSRLKKLDGQLKALDSNAQAAYKELQNYWVVAQAIANPEIGQTFTSAVVKQKQQQKYSSIEQALQKPEGGIF